MAKYELPKLSYAYDALEPHIDAKTMEIHHSKHHQAYTDGLNKALETLSSELQNMELSKLLASLDKVPEATRGAVNFHGGGYDNHSLFWNHMKSNGGGNQVEAWMTQLTQHLVALIVSKRNSQKTQSLFKEAVGAG